jgi:hypothetical protein
MRAASRWPELITALAPPEMLKVRRPRSLQIAGGKRNRLLRLENFALDTVPARICDHSPPHSRH